MIKRSNLRMKLVMIVRIKFIIRIGENMLRL